MIMCTTDFSASVLFPNEAYTIVSYLDLVGVWIIKVNRT